MLLAMRRASSSVKHFSHVSVVWIFAGLLRCVRTSDALYGKHEVSEKLQVRNPHAS